ncbi:MAG: lysophospholipid acyltransferase family protein [Terrimicrobiaceae bacterium]|nr:lysophospholipid acyltransferase family protein [Terrimicrobiaceae bacterium]
MSTHMTFTYWFFATLARILARLFFRFHIIHRERLPETGGFILAANHQSYFDPPLVGICSRRAVHYLARKSLMDWPFFGPMFPKMNVIPVDRGGNDMSALKTVIRKIRSGEGVVLFPEGTRSPDGQLQPAQAGVGLVIAKTLAPVVPVRIFGSYEAFPRGSKGVKLHPISVVIGEPLTFTSEDVANADRETYRRLGQRVMDAIGTLQLEVRK